ncbi:UNVERIFIED_CONTAM: Retrovirus-related Pol polyprotein from transposon TNT 1-94 [Sesamum radiatum]|uniref:Retrovirus-related Pol polyprotein from transposon TNT 1-94 n=1 Tax=Sesamum radiatum TaxID=300843 RepID=A0AAW2VM08_SESRA
MGSKGLDPRRPTKGVRPVGCKWVYKRKLGANGEVMAFKARLVAKRYTQRPGVDFEETYSPVAMANSIRILLAIAAWYDYEIWQMDVKTVFLNGFIEEEIFMDQPEGFTTVGEEQKEAFSMLSSAPGPIVAYTLSVKSRYQACAAEAHWSAIKNILKYLRRTKDMFLIYDGGELILEGYSDASFQSDEDDAKSQSNFVFKLNAGVVAWKSSKQDTTADSTTEAEYIAASEAAKEAIWMKNYIQELGVVPSIAEPVVIFCDNNGAIAQAKEPRSHHRSKHILRRYHLLREMVGRGDSRMDRVSSAENTADPLTKPMSQVAHTQHLDKMGLRSMGDWLLVKWEIVRIAHRPKKTTVQQLDYALDGGHEINCLGLGLKRFKSRTLRMGIESPVETCTKSRIHWMSAAFHRPQMWVVYAILMGWID